MLSSMNLPDEIQVICWVLEEYETADCKYSAAYITGKICDIAEAHSSDDTIKWQGIAYLDVLITSHFLPKTKDFQSAGL
ncbi:PREDICTED: AP-4 complex subunit epsilon-like [Ipomoea nil]|uniref:AP-4 complex subunit epsilon-like n=1 Tax=Ipomoea nil TaxID=35883 RepID=UPI000901CCF1|nr:PREDICTED: AP-4 complex subunit epsilon-like [Ipomoea nil]